MKETQKTTRYDRNKKKVNLTLVQEYDLDEIREGWRKIQSDKNMFEKQLKTLKTQKPIIIKNEKELINLQGQLNQLKSLEEKKKVEGQIKYCEDMIKRAKKEILILEPTIRKIPKK